MNYEFYDLTTPPQLDPTTQRDTSTKETDDNGITIDLECPKLGKRLWHRTSHNMKDKKGNFHEFRLYDDFEIGLNSKLAHSKIMSAEIDDDVDTDVGVMLNAKGVC